MTDDRKVVDLDNHEATVDSVSSRLWRHSEKIENLTVVIEWKGGDFDIAGNTKTLGDLAAAARRLQVEVDRFFDEED